ncbi:MAG: hypothetical protein WCH11_04950, partial [Bdellovibrio sp.]
CLNLASDYCATNSASVQGCSGNENSSPGVTSIESAVTAKDPVTCESSCLGTSLCHAYGIKSIQQHFRDSMPRFILGSCNVKTAGISVSAALESVEINREENSALSCSSNCPLGGFCGSPAPQVSIENYLTNKFDGLKGNFPPAQKRYRAGTCQMETQEKEEPRTFTYLAENFELQKACPANASLIPRIGNPSAPFTNPEKIENIYFVSGGTQSPRADLTSFIRGRSSELLGEFLPMVSVFVRQPGDSIGQGGSVGSVYNSLADLFGGSKHSIYTKDYSPAFARMGEKVKQRLERSIVVPRLKPEYTVSRIWRRTQGQSVWAEPIKPEMWSRSGNTIFFSENFPLTVSDSFRIEFY